jgi:hypothetical protein
MEVHEIINILKLLNWNEEFIFTFVSLIDT